MRRAVRQSLVTGVALVLGGCAGHQQSALDAAGPGAGKTEALWWFFFGVLGVVFLIVLIVMFWALMRRSRGFEQEPLEATHAPSAETEARLTRTVAGATVLTVVILFVLLVSSVSTGRAISSMALEKNSLTVEVTGNQWWWSVRYLDDNASEVVTTANEIHIPVGRPVMIRGASHDVIHSFWVPNLNGKRDLIPGRVTTEWIKADRPGRYRGQCAEFCGMQHAHMSFWVVAEPAEQFHLWKKRQLQTAQEPATPELIHGRDVFLRNACVFCHEIDGTEARGQNGPNLTHFGSRISLGAGTLPNTPGNLAGWIVDPQTIKPGNHMAAVAIPSEDLQPLVRYLESLQ